MNDKLLVMGVAGCGKSTLAHHLGVALGFEVIEGDDFHLPESQAKMAAGIALDDGDRWPWLERLGLELQSRAGGTVLACSSLKRSYRQLLRAAVPELRIVYVHISPEESRRRVATRSQHLFPASLVDSQFAALESPAGEPGVLQVEATGAIADQIGAVRAWLATSRLS
jgi:gluconokinase